MRNCAPSRPNRASTSSPPTGGAAGPSSKPTTPCSASFPKQPRLKPCCPPCSPKTRRPPSWQPFLRKGPSCSKKALPVPNRTSRPTRPKVSCVSSASTATRAKIWTKKSASVCWDAFRRSSHAVRGGTSPCWCAPTGRPHRSPDGSWRKGSPSSPTTASCSPSILWWNRSRRS